MTRSWSCKHGYWCPSSFWVRVVGRTTRATGTGVATGIAVGTMTCTNGETVANPSPNGFCFRCDTLPNSCTRCSADWVQPYWANRNFGTSYTSLCPVLFFLSFLSNISMSDKCPEFGSEAVWCNFVAYPTADLLKIGHEQNMSCENVLIKLIPRLLKERIH